MDAHLATLLTQFEETLQSEPLDYPELLVQGRALIDSGHAEALLASIQQVFAPGTPKSPDLRLLEAEARMTLGHLSEAILGLESVQMAFSDVERVDGELRCLLRLAQIYHALEDLAPAHLFTEEAVALLRAHPGLDPLLQADTYLALARLAPDIGQLSQGLHFAQEALHCYETAKHPRGQFDATMLISGMARQLGRLQMSQAHLTMAKRWLPHVAQRPSSHALILNAEAHQHWYQGNFGHAERILRQAIVEADATPQSKFCVYQRIVLANVLRAWGRYDEAEAMYAETEAVVEATHFGLFQVWVTANRGWLYLLQGNYTPARRSLFQALATTDKGQAASFNASLAVLYLLSGRLAEAEELLRRSLHFYQTSGDELSIFALRIHLAYLYLQTGQTERAEEEISLGLGWAAQWNVDYFPHWWHAKIVATVCVHALASELHPSLAERILVKRLGEAAIPILHTLETASSPAVRRRVEDVLSLLNVLPLEHITEIEDEPVRQVLTELFASGRLHQQKLPQLARLLSTTRQSDKANPVLLATFGLYVHGSTRREIAERLHLSETSIRNYITDIYEKFGLESKGGSRQVRYQQLCKLAAEAGYVFREE
jgi:tetratricopeptide (TPR) repeat protein